jgi:hypothetical protein
MGDTGAVDLVGKMLVWQYSRSYQGSVRDMSVRLRPRDGRTRIIVEENISRLAVRVFGGIGTGGLGAMVFSYLPLIAKHGSLDPGFPLPANLVRLVPLLALLVMFVLARTIFVAVARRRHRALRELLSDLTKEAGPWASPVAPSRARVAASSGSDVLAENEVEGGARTRR